MFVANFRHAFARYREDPHFEELLEERLMRSDDFARMWARWDVLPPDQNAAIMVRDRARGVCELARWSKQVSIPRPDCYLSIFSCKQMS